MSIVDNHLYLEKPKRGKRVSQKQLDEYDRVQRLIEEVQVDLVNGTLRSEIFNKFRERQYENLNPNKDIGERQIQNYIKAAWELLKEDRVERVQATLMGNTLVAKSVLDSIAKIFLPDEKTLNLNADVKGDITIDFNLMTDNET